MQRSIVLAVFLFFSQSMVLFAQQPTGAIAGIVVDEETRKPLTGAHLRILELDQGVVTDIEGRFRIEEVPAGVYTVEISYIGFQTRTLTDIIVRSNRIETIEVVLQTSAVEGEEITVSSGYFQRDETQHVSRATMNREEIRRSPGAGQELSRVITTVPGVATTENTQDLMVRGGSPQENANYINNIFVPTVEHFEGEEASAYGPIGLVNTDLVEKLEFYAGGFSASYGNRMSSVADINYRRGSRERLQGQIDVNMSGFGGTVEGPAGENGSFLLSGSRSYLDLIAGALNVVGAPRFGDIQGKFDVDINKNNRLTVLQIFGDSGSEWDRNEMIDEGRINYLDMHNQVNTSGLNWRRFWDDQVFSNTSVSYSFLSQDIQFRYTDTDNIELDYNNRHDYVSFRNVTYWRVSDIHRFEFGGDLNYTNGDFDYYFAPDVNEANVNRPEINRNLQVDNWNAELFGSYILRPLSALTITIGNRMGYNNINENWAWSPRLGASYQLTQRLTLKASGGIYRQELPLFIRSQQESFRELNDPYVRQIITGFDYLLGESTQLTVEVYDKQYRQIPIQPEDYDAGPPTYVFDDGGRFFDELEDNGEAWARGIDLMIHRKIADGFYGTLSGSFFRSRYKDHTGEWQDRDFDVEYLFNVIGGFRPNNNWEVSMRWTYIGSRPYTPLDLGASRSQSRGILDLNRYNQEDMPAFHSLYLRGDRRFFLNRLTLTAFVEVWNAYNNSNVEDYYWNQNEQQRSAFEPFSFLPVGGVLIEF